MKCPLLAMGAVAISSTVEAAESDCLKEECAWWNDRFGMCSQAVDAYLKGQEDWRREKETIRKGG